MKPFLSMLVMSAALSAGAAYAAPAGEDGVVIPPEIEAAASAADDIRGLHGPLEIRATPWAEILAGTGLLGLGALSAVLLLKRRKKPLTPEALAAMRLEEAYRHVQADAPREYAIEVSDAVRAYLEAVYGLHAPTRTTDEFLRDLLEAPDAVKAHRDHLESFMAACDAAKFGQGALSQPQMKKMHSTAQAVIERRAA